MPMTNIEKIRATKPIPRSDFINSYKIQINCANHAKLFIFLQ